jgi:hypothetical protein
MWWSARCEPVQRRGRVTSSPGAFLPLRRHGDRSSRCHRLAVMDGPFSGRVALITGAIQEFADAAAVDGVEPAGQALHSTSQTVPVFRCKRPRRFEKEWGSSC